jgi:hypothetical protein
MNAITNKSSSWDEFIGRLEGPEGCDFKDSGFTCFGDHRLSRKILAEMILSEREIEASIKFFEENGGFCDCEVVLNLTGPSPYEIYRELMERTVH